MQKKITQFQKMDNQLYALTDDGKLYIRSDSKRKSKYEPLSYEWKELNYPFPKETAAIEVKFDKSQPHRDNIADEVYQKSQEPGSPVRIIREFPNWIIGAEEEMP